MNETEDTSPSPQQRSNRPPRGPGNGRRRRRGWLWIVLTIVLFAVLINMLRPRPLAVEIAQIDRGPLVVSVVEEGKTRIRNRYVISPPLAGSLLRTTLRAGDKLVAGETVVAALEPQPSVFLDPRTQAQARAAVEAAESVLKLRSVETERASAALKLVQKELQRAEELKRDQAISDSDLDYARTEAVIRERDLRGAEFAVQVAQFELEQARAALTQGTTGEPGAEGMYEIISPISGVVLKVFEESGRAVTPGTPLMEVGDPLDLEIEVELLSQDAVGVRPGAEVLIERWGGETPLPARVTVVEPAAFTKISALGVEEQRVNVRADFDTPLPSDRPLGDRFRVEARVITWRSDDVLRIPVGALFRQGGDWVTFVFEDGEARSRILTIDHNNGHFARVVEGVSPETSVIMHPPDVIAEGTKVRAR